MKEIFSSPLLTLFNPPIFQFCPWIKISECVFRNFSSLNSAKKFRKHVSKFVFKAKKSQNAFRSLKPGKNKKFKGGRGGREGGREDFLWTRKLFGL
jgi:hypothetical protein